MKAVKREKKGVASADAAGLHAFPGAARRHVRGDAGVYEQCHFVTVAQLRQDFVATRVALRRLACYHLRDRAGAYHYIVDATDARFLVTAEDDGACHAMHDQ